MTPINVATNNATIAPLTPLAGQPSTTGSATPATSADLLPAPPPAGYAGDVGQAIASLLIESSFERRKNSREVKQKAAVGLERAEKNELSQLRKAADDTRIAAQIGAWTQIGTGALQVGSLGLDKAGFSVGGAVGTAMKDGGKDLATGMSELASSAWTHDAKMHEASAKEAAQAQEKLKNAVSDAQDDVKATEGTVDKALEFLKEWTSAKDSAAAAAIHRA